MYLDILLVSFYPTDALTRTSFAMKYSTILPNTLMQHAVTAASHSLTHAHNISLIPSPIHSLTLLLLCAQPPVTCLTTLLNALTH